MEPRLVPWTISFASSGPIFRNIGYVLVAQFEDNSQKYTAMTVDLYLIFMSIIISKSAVFVSWLYMTSCNDYNVYHLRRDMADMQ